MTAHSSDPGSNPRSHWNIYRDLREHQERKLTVQRILEARRVRQIERVVQTARERRFRRRDT